jgi:hypothetical protein
MANWISIPGTTAKPLKRTIDYVELPELQRSNEGNSTEDVVDQFHFDASYQYAVKCLFFAIIFT